MVAGGPWHCWAINDFLGVHAYRSTAQPPPAREQTRITRCELHRGAMMDLNQVTLPATDVGRSADFYRALGFTQIVANLPSYVRFECKGGPTFSLHHVDSVAANTGR